MPSKELEISIEIEICHWLEQDGHSIDKIISEGYYNATKGIYQKRTHPYARPGISDIIGTLHPSGHALYIEVKRPDEMSFFNISAKEAEERYIDAKYYKRLSKESLKKYEHAMQQTKFIESKRLRGACALFASSVGEVRLAIENFMKCKK